MSDLLAQLVVRTFTDTPVIRPRLEPRFSTAPAIDESIVETTARPLSPPAAANDAAETRTTLLASSPPPTEQAAETSEPPIEHREIVSERKNSERPALPPQAKEGESSQPPVPIARQQPTKREPQAAVAPPSPQRVKTTRQISPATKPAVVRFEKGEPPSAGPIVRVTIGRIDVRATPAPAPTPRKPARLAPPALTLEAYLNSRKGGAR